MPAKLIIVATVSFFLLISSCGGDGESGSETVLHSFGATITDGLEPLNIPIQAKDGNFYGLTFGGGANGLSTVDNIGTSGYGTFYKVTPDGAETILYSFGASDIDGYGPIGTLIQAADGNFYGTTEYGGTAGIGTVFKITPAGVETILYSFGAPATNIVVPNGVLQGRDGNFYGTTQLGGAYSSGSFFMLTPSGVETTLYSFSGVPSTNGYHPNGLIQGADGNFYGTTADGGAIEQGIVFSITPTGQESVIYTFGASETDGYEPLTTLTQDSAGNFYGTTSNGNSTIGGGTIFKVTPAGVETVLHSFTPSTDGSGPSSVIVGADGNLYGAAGVGPNGGGTVFMMTPAAEVTLLYSFVRNSTNGDGPTGVILGTDGNLYGSTAGGGVGNHGTVFKITL